MKGISNGMSRIGKLPVVVPPGVELNIQGRQIEAKGPKGQLGLKLPVGVSAQFAEGLIKVSLTDENQPALWGLSRSLIFNLVAGVSEGYSKVLEIQGVGYKAQVSGDILTLNLGYSHAIEYKLPAGIEAQIEGNNLTISGIDKQLVGQVAAEIRDFRRPEPYKGKGIRYSGEQVRRKAGKTAGKVESS